MVNFHEIVFIEINSKKRWIIIDLRTNYVHFVLAFFKHGDAEIKKQVLGVKGLVSGIFVGMDEDAYPVNCEIYIYKYTII